MISNQENLFWLYIRADICDDIDLKFERNTNWITQIFNVAYSEQTIQVQDL